MNVLRNKLTLILAGFALVLSVFAPQTGFADEKGWPRTIKHEAGELTIEKKPQRVVSTALSATGTLLAINAPLVASAATVKSSLTDDTGFFKQWSDIAHERGVEVLYPNLEFDLEAVIASNPDLLIVSITGGDAVFEHYDELVAQGIPTLVINYSNKSWQELAAQFGDAMGLEDEVDATVERFDRRIAQIAKTFDAPNTPATIVSYNLRNTYAIGNINSPHAAVLRALGLNIVDIPEGVPYDDRNGRSDFGFISFENLSSAVAGDSVFLLRGTEKSVTEFLAEPTLANLPAVKTKQVYPLGVSSFRMDYYSGLAMAELVANYLGK